MENHDLILPSELGFTPLGSRESFVIKERTWIKYSEPVQEKLIKTRNIILIEPIPTKKELAVKILNAVDISTKEGQQNMDKVFDKVESGFKKVDDIFDQFDKAMNKFDTQIQNAGSNFGKNLGSKPNKKRKDFDLTI